MKAVKVYFLGKKISLNFRIFFYYSVSLGEPQWKRVSYIAFLGYPNYLCSVDVFNILLVSLLFCLSEFSLDLFTLDLLYFNLFKSFIWWQYNAYMHTRDAPKSDLNLG